MAKSMESVLYYNPGRPETMGHTAMLKSVLVRMGVRIRNVAPDQVLETVGYLAGVEGFTASGGEKDQEEIPGGAQVIPGGADVLPGGSGAIPGGAQAFPEIPEEVLVLKQFSSQRLDQLLMNLRKAGVPKIALKAVLTEHNSGWTFYHLYQELKEEHEAMAAGIKS